MGELFKILSVCKGGGYRYCRTEPPHPRRNAMGLYPHHRVVMENVLGRLLHPNEDVHHRNEDKYDDRPENLEVLTKSAHAQLHRRASAPESTVFTCQCGSVVTLMPHVYNLRTKRNKRGRIYCSRRCAGHFVRLGIGEPPAL